MVAGAQLPPREGADAGLLGGPAVLCKRVAPTGAFKHVWHGRCDLPQPRKRLDLPSGVLRAHVLVSTAQVPFVLEEHVRVARLEEPRQACWHKDQPDSSSGCCAGHTQMQVLPGAVHEEDRLVGCLPRSERPAELRHQQRHAVGVCPAALRTDKLDVCRQLRSQDAEVPDA